MRSLGPGSGVSGAKTPGGAARKKTADRAKANPRKPIFDGITSPPLWLLFIIRIPAGWQMPEGHFRLYLIAPVGLSWSNQEKRMKSIRVGLIGTGYIGLVHLEMLRRIVGVEVLAVADQNREAAGRAAEKMKLSKAKAAAAGV